MAKEFFKAEYKKGVPHGYIKTAHNMSYEHIKALHAELTSIMKQMEAQQRHDAESGKPEIVKFRAEQNARVIKRLPSGAAEKFFFGVVGSVEAV